MLGSLFLQLRVEDRFVTDHTVVPDVVYHKIKVEGGSSPRQDSDVKLVTK